MDDYFDSTQYRCCTKCHGSYNWKAERNLDVLKQTKTILKPSKIYPYSLHVFPTMAAHQCVNKYKGMVTLAPTSIANSEPIWGWKCCCSPRERCFVGELCFVAELCSGSDEDFKIFWDLASNICNQFDIRLLEPYNIGKGHHGTSLL